MSYQQQQQPLQISSPTSPGSNRSNNQVVSTPQTQYNNTGTTNNQQLQPYIFQRNPPPPESGFSVFNIIETVTGTHDLSPTFWVPDTSKGEYSLLGALVKRQSQHHAPEDYLPLAMRPDLELANNFSTYKGERIDLSSDRFKLSRATQTLSHLSRSTPASSPAALSNNNYNNSSGADQQGFMSLSDVREGIRSGISQMQVDEYFMVKYRDYSEFAVNRWSEEAQRERLLSPKYVEKYFAVRVGSSHGVFIPINENQFIRGNEILSTANMSPEAVANNKVYVALNADQFKSVGAPSKEFVPKEENKNGDGNNGGGGAKIDDPDLDLPPPPHPLDFSAEAFNIRWKRFARRQYHNMGRLAIRIVVVGAAVYFVRYYYFNNKNQQDLLFEDGGKSMRRRNSRNTKTSGQLVKDVVSLPVNILGMVVSSALGNNRGGDDE